MSSQWEMVPLGEVLTKSDEWIQLHPDQKYKEVTVRLWGKGATLRREVLGAEIAAESRLRVHTNQFIISRIDARNGASGLIPEDLEGAVVSNDFPVFVPNVDRLETGFLGWLSKTKTFVELCKAASEGTTNRVRLKEDRFLTMPIPFPPLTEQRRLVERIDAVAAKIEEAMELREDASTEAHAVFAATRASIFQRLREDGVKPLDTVARLERGKFTHRPRNEPRFFGGEHPWIQIGEIESSRKYITSYSQTLNDHGLAISRKFPKRTLLISIAATIGAVGILGFDCCIPDSIVAVTPTEGVEGEYLYHLLGYLRTHLEDVAPQSAQKNINLQTLSGLKVPVPAVDKQRDIVCYLDRLEEQTHQLATAQSHTRKELDAILPAILDRAFRGEL